MGEVSQEGGHVRCRCREDGPLGRAEGRTEEDRRVHCQGPECGPEGLLEGAFLPLRQHVPSRAQVLSEEHVVCRSERTAPVRNNKIRTNQRDHMWGLSLVTTYVRATAAGRHLLFQINRDYRFISSTAAK